MTTTMPYIQWWKGSYRFRRPIPKKHQATFGGKAYFPTKSLGTPNEAEANRIVIPHIEETNRMLQLAEAGEWPPVAAEWIEETAVRWWASIDREEPFENEDELVASLSRYLAMNDLTIAEHTSERLKREAIDLHGDFSPEVERRWRARHELGLALSLGKQVAVLNGARASAVVPPSPQAGNPISIWTIYDDWAAESRAAAKTVYSWKRIITKLTNHVGHEDAARITDIDIIDWKDALVSSELSPKTIENHLTITKTLFNWATANKRIPNNPASTVRYKAKDDPSKKKLPYDDDETSRILTAARKEKEPHKRWVPWLCAFTGARVDEICGAMVKDLEVIDGHRCLHIRPDYRERGGSVKNEGSIRAVPLHRAIVAEGFLDYVSTLEKNGPLFPNVTPDMFGKRGGNGSKTIGRWIREKVKITNPRLQPNHAWRHRFKSQCRKAGIREDIDDYLTGHKGGGIGRKYGDFGGDVLAEAIAKLPVPV